VLINSKFYEERKEDTKDVDYKKDTNLNLEFSVQGFNETPLSMF
jgi:hypothetical protein